MLEVEIRGPGLPSQLGKIIPWKVDQERGGGSYVCNQKLMKEYRF